MQLTIYDCKLSKFMGIWIVESWARTAICRKSASRRLYVEWPIPFHSLSLISIPERPSRSDIARLSTINNNRWPSVSSRYLWHRIRDKFNRITHTPRIPLTNSHRSIKHRGICIYGQCQQKTEKNCNHLRSMNSLCYETWQNQLFPEIHLNLLINVAAADRATTTTATDKKPKNKPSINILMKPKCRCSQPKMFNILTGIPSDLLHSTVRCFSAFWNFSAGRWCRLARLAYEILIWRPSHQVKCLRCCFTFDFFFVSSFLYLFISFALLFWHRFWWMKWTMNWTRRATNKTKRHSDSGAAVEVLVEFNAYAMLNINIHWACLFQSPISVSSSSMCAAVRRSRWLFELVKHCEDWRMKCTERIAICQKKKTEWLHFIFSLFAKLIKISTRFWWMLLTLAVYLRVFSSFCFLSFRILCNHVCFAEKSSAWVLFWRFANFWSAEVRSSGLYGSEKREAEKNLRKNGKEWLFAFQVFVNRKQISFASNRMDNSSIIIIIKHGST